ncbi:hypothetical protein ACLOJK_009761 [Asimina triloba]
MPGVYQQEYTPSTATAVPSPTPSWRQPAALRIPPSKTTHLGRLMRLLLHTPFIALQKIDLNESRKKEEEEKEGYVLTPSSKLLLKEGAEKTMAPVVLFRLDLTMMKAHHFLSTWLMGEAPSVFETAHGAPFFEFAAGIDPEFGSFFNEVMASTAHFTMDMVLSKCGHVFHGLRSLVDVGGGTGAAAVAIANAFPHMKCSAVDLPHVVASAPERNNVTMVAECVKILKRCKEAIPSREEGGKVIALEMVVKNGGGDYKELETQLAFDVWMMLISTGKERDEKEWQTIFYDAGFTHCRITPVCNMRSAIEIYP